MSSLGYAIAFMLCASDGTDCQMVGLRASRFVDLTQCRATIPDALRVATGRKPSGVRLSATCQSLDHLCGLSISSLGFAISQPRAGSLVHRIRIEKVGNIPSTLVAPLAILCVKPPEADCSG